MESTITFEARPVMPLDVLAGDVVWFGRTFRTIENDGRDCKVRCGYRLIPLRALDDSHAFCVIEWREESYLDVLRVKP